ncbi:MAG: DUF6542 domain-containing protein [Nocardioides sp.]
MSWADWQEGQEPGRQVVALGLAVALTVAALDLTLVGRLSFFFDLCFVTLCVALAGLVRRGDFFTVGVLPPLMMVGLFALVAVVAPASIADPGDSLVQRVVSGLALHSGALVVGYALCLGILALRQRRG